jgi:hypothetical protein
MVCQDQVAHSQLPQYGIAYEATAINILLPCRQQYYNKYLVLYDSALLDRKSRVSRCPIHRGSSARSLLSYAKAIVKCETHVAFRKYKGANRGRENLQ